MAQHSRWEDSKRRAGVNSTPERRAAYEQAGRDQELGRLVYELRTRAGLTQAELAERMGTTQAAISRLEEGGGTPRLDTLTKLAEAVGRGFVVSFPANDEDDPEPTALTLR